MLDWKRYRTDLASGLSRQAIFAAFVGGGLLAMFAFFLGYFVLLAQSPWWLRAPISLGLVAIAAVVVVIGMLLVHRAYPPRKAPPSLVSDGIKWVYTGTSDMPEVGMRPECPEHGIELMVRLSNGELLPLFTRRKGNNPYCARGHEIEWTDSANYAEIRDRVWAELAAKARSV